MHHAAPLTPAELHTLLAHLLAGVVGGTEEHWGKLIGEVEALPIALHPHCNWRIKPRGASEDREAITKAAEVVREAHPYVSGGS